MTKKIKKSFVCILAILSLFLSFFTLWSPIKTSADESKQEFKITGVKGMYFHTLAQHFLIEIEVPDEYGLEVSNSAYAHMETYGKGKILINGNIDLCDLDKQTLVMSAMPFRSNILALYIWPNYKNGEQAFDEIESITFKKGFSIPGLMPESLRDYELKEDMVWTPTQAFSVANTESGAPTPFAFDDGIRAVLFYDIAGNVVWTTTVQVGEDVALLDAPEVDGYTFKGWDHSGENITQTTHIRPIYEPIQVEASSNFATTAWIIVGCVNSVVLIAAVVGIMLYVRALKKKNPKE